MPASTKVCEEHKGGDRFCRTCGFGKREHRPEYRARINAAVDARQNAAPAPSDAPRPRSPLYVIHGGRS